MSIIMPTAEPAIRCSTRSCVAMISRKWSTTSPPGCRPDVELIQHNHQGQAGLLLKDAQQKEEGKNILLRVLCGLAYDLHDFARRGGEQTDSLLHQAIKTRTSREDNLINSVALAMQEIGQNAGQKTVEEKAGGLWLQIEIKKQDAVTLASPLELKEMFYRSYAGRLGQDETVYRATKSPRVHG